MLTRGILLVVSSLALSSNLAYSEPKFIFRLGSSAASESSSRQSAIEFNIRSLRVGEQLTNVRALLIDSTEVVDWTLTGDLPSGVIFNPDGTLTGSPATSGTFSFNLNAFVAGELQATRTFSWTVSPIQSVDAPSIDERTFSGKAHNFEIFQMAVSGGKAPYQFSIAAGAMPSGFLLEQHYFYGTTSDVGTYPLSIRVVDADGVEAINDIEIQIAPGISLQASFPEGYVGEPYSGQFIANGGTEPYSWNVGGTPPGLSWNDNVISGVPSVAGNHTVTGTVSSSDLEQTAAGTIRIFDPVRLVDETVLKDFYIGENYSVELIVAGGKPSYHWQVVDHGTLSPSISMVRYTTTAGRLNSTVGTVGDHHFTAAVTDANGRTDTKTFSFKVYPAMGVISGSTGWNKNVDVGQAINFPMSVSGGKAPYTWSISAGSLPAGVSLTNEGVLSGSPTAPGTYNFIVKATDQNNRAQFRAFEVVVSP